MFRNLVMTPQEWARACIKSHGKAHGLYISKMMEFKNLSQQSVSYWKQVQVFLNKFDKTHVDMGAIQEMALSGVRSDLVNNGKTSKEARDAS